MGRKGTEVLGLIPHPKPSSRSLSEKAFLCATLRNLSGLFGEIAQKNSTTETGEIAQRTTEFSFLRRTHGRGSKTSLFSELLPTSSVVKAEVVAGPMYNSPRIFEAIRQLCGVTRRALPAR